MKYLIVHCLIFFVSGIYAQKISPNVVASAGNSVENGGIALQWTLGELSIQFFSKDNSNLSEGFNQAFSVMMSTAISEEKLGEQVSLFPNPAKEFLKVSTDHIGILEYKVYDSYGRILKIGKFQLDTVIETVEFAKGSYFIILITRQNKRGVYSFIKT